MNDTTGVNNQNTQKKGEEQSLIRRGLEQVRKPFKALLDWMSPSTVGAFVALALGISLAIDYFIYFPELGISAFEVPISIADSFRSAVIWLPPFIVATIAAVVASLLPSILPENIYYSKIIYRRNGKISLPPISHVLISLLLIFANLYLFIKGIDWISEWISREPRGLVSSLIGVPWWGILIWSILVCLIVWLSAWIFQKISTKSENSEDISMFSFSTIVYLIVFVALIAFFAYNRAQSDQSRATASRNQTILIRSFEQYLLVGHGGDLKFLNTDQVDCMEIEADEIIVIPKTAGGGSTCP